VALDKGWNIKQQGFFKREWKREVKMMKRCFLAT
jgi:hypothetical protein